MAIWFWTAGIGVALWLLQAFFAWRKGMLTPADMQESYIQQGIPFTGHGSTWWVLGCLIPIVATLVSLYASQWSGAQWFLAIAVGVIGSGMMHWLYTQAPYPDFMVSKGQLSAAGWAHFVLFAGVIAVLVLTYTSTTHVDKTKPIVTTVYMVWHVFVGNHMLTKTNPPDWFPPYPFWDIGPWGTVLGVAVILGGATMFALR